MTRRRALLVFAAALAVYLNSLGGQFVFDDTAIVQNNLQIRGLQIENLRQIFGGHYWQTVAGQGGLYRPVVMLSYALNHAIGGLDPWGYHFVNILLHAVNSVLVFLVIGELFANPAFSFWSGLLFALHPIRTEAVAYIAGRAETLAALFFLLAWWMWLRGRRVLPAALFLLAVLSKESAFTFLAVLPLSDWVRRRPWDWRGYLASVAAAGTALGLRFAVLGSIAPLEISAAANPLAAVDTWTRVLTATHVLGKYLFLLVFPIPLSADYSFYQIPPLETPWTAAFLVPLAVVSVVAAAMVWDARRSRVWFFCAAFYLATFSLTSNFLRPIGTIMAERLMYLPSLGFTCAVAWLAATARRKETAAAAVVLLSLFYAGRTILRNADWRDHLSLFSSAAVVSPNSSLVQANLAHALLHTKGDAQGAVEHAREAIRIEPGDPAAHMTLAEAYQRLGDLRRAAEAYGKVEELARGSAGGQEAARRRAEILRALTSAPQSP